MIVGQGDSFFYSLFLRTILLRMKQLIQNFKTGELYVGDIPPPSISQGMVLVENSFSLISAGTERGTVKVAQANLLGKAKQRPDLVAQVLKNVKREGLMATLQKVQTKLDSLKALGYSTAGVVQLSLDSQCKFKSGDRVACAGQDYASHAEMVAVPQNLVAKVPDNVSLEEAAFTTLGAIALQGVRQADPRLGESVCVIGLGLLGQLTCQLLRANGCRVLGIDLSDRLVSLAKEHSTDEAINRGHADLLKICESFTRGQGFDNIIITAAAPTNDPIELSAELARKKGKVIVVGAVKMDVPRDPHFYRKELELKMSCSYGPGRYDTRYEEDGQDYPYAYVRWTEQRNMEAFLDLVSKGLLRIKPLITHVFQIDEAEKAYDLVLGKINEPSIGILLSYPTSERKFDSIVPSSPQPQGDASIGFIGAGSFAQSYLIPNLKKLNVGLHTVVTTKGINSKNVADKFGFGFSSSNPEDILLKKEIDTVFIATPHNSHANYVIQSLINQKNVFVEKPLALTYDEIEEIKKAYLKSPKTLMVGFNRRFSQAAILTKQHIASLKEPKVMSFRINAGFLPKDHWTQKEEIGGGRILGELCHWVDLMQFFTDSKPIEVFATAIQTSNAQYTPLDNVAVNIRFGDGSIGAIAYIAIGDPSLGKEFLEVFCAGKVGVIDDFKNVTLHGGNRAKKTSVAGKGHEQEIAAFIQALRQGGESPISFESIIATSLTCLAVRDSLVTGLKQSIE